MALKPPEVRDLHVRFVVPLPCCWCLGKSCYSLSCKTEPTPLVKLYLFFLSHLVNRNAKSRRSAGRSGQAEMPNRLGVSPPRQVLPGLHSRPYLHTRSECFLELISCCLLSNQRRFVSRGSLTLGAPFCARAPSFACSGTVQGR